MIISVIIPTYNGKHKLVHILNSLEHQSCIPDEVVIVVDGSTDGTAAFLREQKFELPALRIIEQENGGRAKVRNTGAQHAQGDLLVFFDDDMRPDQDCIKIHLEHHIKFPGTILTGAQIDPSEPEMPDMRRYKAFLTRKWEEKFLAFVERPLNKEVVTITGANFSISAKLFDELGGFEEQLRDAEDYDMAVRAFDKGILLYYNHTAFAWHDDVHTCKSYIKRMREYAKAQNDLNELNDGYESKYTIKVPTGLKGLFFRFFCHPFWIWSVDADVWKKLLPEKWRFKLYDFVITANGSFFPEIVKLS